MDPEEILYRLKFISEASDTPGDQVADALSHIPADACDWVLDNVFFLCPDVVNGVAYSFSIQPALIERIDDHSFQIRIAYIAPHVFDADVDECRRVVAHEVAHHWLRHDGVAYGNEQFEHREREVEAILEEWGITSPRK